MIMVAKKYSSLVRDNVQEKAEIIKLELHDLFSVFV